MFELISKNGRARRGVYHTPHGDIQTPAFMNVATQAAIKGGLSARDLENAGCQVALCNTYHLHLRPGEDVVSELGGLHGFMNWNGPILTDSGGFQVFSLAKLRKITEEGVEFSSHIDGRRIFMRPEDSINIQKKLGADIIMAFDECVENPAPREYVKASAARTERWLKRCVNALGDGETPHLWGINQGGVFEDIRVDNMRAIAETDLPGYAIGGLAVGETAEEMYRIIETVEPHMPENKPRYLMGVGTPENIAEAVKRGVDFFDCVLPARNARHGKLYTSEGALNMKNERFKRDNRPVDENCGCELCANYSRAYLRHLFVSGEMLAMRLAVGHNLRFYNNTMEKIREQLTEYR
ncbi:MAG: tRNA guanosine(34) transglycosylase Tgt [Oscillospiraceae bacterium]|nr:tRNA guanosine(34) transglycosylase Tgt [Oscillospiraceae bacterium]